MTDMPSASATPSLPLISIAVPTFNESDNIDPLYARLNALAQRMSDRCRLEFVFTDNHSTDDTWEKLVSLAHKDERVRAIRFARNVGFQRSIFANYLHARGDAVLQIDADLQDPPELLERFFELWQGGYEVVYGIRRRRTEGAITTALRRVGYWAINAISEHPIPRDAGDFRLVDRKVIDAISRMRTPKPYLRGMVAGLGFNQTGVPYDRGGRTAGQSKFGLARVLRLGLTAVLNHSSVPLRTASVLGVVALCLSVFGALYYLLLRLTHPDLPTGLASIHILVLFGIGLQSLLLGIIGEYLLRIYLILRAEPLAVIERTINIPAEELRL
jgi:dolichol-phosphate mannosyltransferase